MISNVSYAWLLIGPWKITPVEILMNLLKHFFHLFSLAARVNNWPLSISGEITKLCNSSPQILLKTQTDPHRRSSSVIEGAMLWIYGKHDRIGWIRAHMFVLVCVCMFVHVCLCVCVCARARVCVFVCVCACLSVCTAYIACTQLWGEWDELERLLAVFPSSGQNTACSPLVRLSQASTRWKPFGQPPHQTRRCPGQKKESWVYNAGWRESVSEGCYHPASGYECKYYRINGIPLPAIYYWKVWEF